MRVKKGKLFAILLFLFVLSLALQFAFLDGTAFAQSKVKCYVCGKELQPGTYWLFGSKPVCQECYNTLPKCEVCKIPVKKFVYVDGRKVCYDCYYRLSACSVCGRRAIQVWTLKDPSTGITKSYCNECIVKYGPHCAACGQPVVNSSSGEYQEVFSRLTGERKFYCDNCYNTLRKCDVCGLLVRAGIRPLSDGRYLCEDCLKTAVYDYSETKTIYDEIVPSVQKILGGRIEFVPPLYLVDQKQFDEVTKNSPGGAKDLLGLTWCTLNVYSGGRMDVSNMRIYILFAQPRIEMYWTVAHEFGHAWFYQNCPPDQSKEIIEGFAQWVAYKEAQIKGNITTINHNLRRTDEYGSGLRKLIEIEKRGGVRAVLKYVNARGY